jgi:carotenoid cleavage dioxygenase
MLEPAIHHSSGMDGNPEVDPARYLAPVADELDVVDLPVEGEIPPDLDGSYVRNGPNPQYPLNGSGMSRFDGDGMLHVLTFLQGRARYRNMWVVTKDLVAEREANRAVDGPAPHNWSNTNVVAHAGKILSLWEGGAPYELSWRFGTVGEHTFDGGLDGPMTAHPKIDPVWDELCFFGTSTEPPYLTFGVVSPRGHISRTIQIDLPRPVLMHDFAITDQHIVFFDSPAVVSRGVSEPGGPIVEWQPEHGTRIGVLAREGESERVKWFPVENRFAMHFLNAYTEGDSVIVDYIHRDSYDRQTASGINQSPTLHRCVLNLGRGSADDEMFDSTPVDFPRIDDRRTGLHHRFGYFAAVTHSDGRPNGVGFDTLVRYDLHTTDVAQHRFPDGVVVGEPQFVARRDSLAEGDGWILALTYDMAHDRSALVVIDARDFDARPHAVVHLPRRVPAGLHGTWLPAHTDVETHRKRG